MPQDSSTDILGESRSASLPFTLLPALSILNSTMPLLLQSGLPPTFPLPTSPSVQVQGPAEHLSLLAPLSQGEGSYQQCNTGTSWIRYALLCCVPPAAIRVPEVFPLKCLHIQKCSYGGSCSAAPLVSHVERSETTQDTLIAKPEIHFHSSQRPGDEVNSSRE